MIDFAGRRRAESGHSWGCPPPRGLRPTRCSTNDAVTATRPSRPCQLSHRHLPICLTDNVVRAAVASPVSRPSQSPTCRARNVGFAVVPCSNASIHAAISRIQFDDNDNPNNRWRTARRGSGDLAVPVQCRRGHRSCRPVGVAGTDPADRAPRTLAPTVRNDHCSRRCNTGTGVITPTPPPTRSSSTITSVSMLTAKTTSND
jgi:hypothetical protein